MPQRERERKRDERWINSEQYREKIQTRKRRGRTNKKKKDRARSASSSSSGKRGGKTGRKKSWMSRQEPTEERNDWIQRSLVKEMNKLHEEEESPSVRIAYKRKRVEGGN